MPTLEEIRRARNRENRRDPKLSAMMKNSKRSTQRRDKKDTVSLEMKQHISKLEKINAQLTNELNIEIDKNVTSSDCSSHSMYQNAQAKIREMQDEINDLQARIDNLDKIHFVPANEVSSPPNLFSVPIDSDMMREYYFEGVSPIQAISKLRQILNTVASLNIGWRVID